MEILCIGELAYMEGGYGIESKLQTIIKHFPLTSGPQLCSLDPILGDFRSQTPWLSPFRKIPVSVPSKPYTVKSWSRL